MADHQNDDGSFVEEVLERANITTDRDDTDEQDSMTRRDFVKGAAAAGASSVLPGSGSPGKSGNESSDTADGEQAAEEHVSLVKTQQEMEQYIDEESRTSLWEYLSFRPDFEEVETQHIGQGVDLVLHTSDGGAVHYMLTQGTGFNREERTYIRGRAEQVAELYKHRPDLYADTDTSPANRDVERVDDLHRPAMDPDEQESVSEELEQRVDEASREDLWTYFSMNPGFDQVSVQELDSDGYRMTMEHDDGSEAYVLAIADETGFDQEEQEYIVNNVDRLAALYKNDRTRYLDTE